MSDATFDTQGYGEFVRAGSRWFDPEGNPIDSMRVVAMLDAVEYYRARARAITPPPHAQTVLVSDQMVERLALAPSEPVTIQIRASKLGEWMEFVCTAHHCPEKA